MEVPDDDCLLSDIDVAQLFGDPLRTRATEMSSRPRLAGRQSTMRCMGCQATCQILQPAGTSPKYVGSAQEALRAACPDFHVDDDTV